MADKKDDISLPVFDGKDWAKWKFRLLLTLETKNCKEVLNNEIPEGTGSTAASIEQWKKSDVKARSIIVQGVSNAQLELIINEKTAADMLKKLNAIYEPSSTALKLLAKRKLLGLKMKQEDDPQDFITVFERHINELKNTGEIIEEEDQLNYLLLALPDSCSTIIDIIDALAPTQRTVEYVKSKLLIDFKRNNTEEHKNTSQGHVFNSQASSSNRYEEHFQRKETEQKCYRCGRPGHIKRYCRSFGNRGRYRGSPSYRGNYRGGRRKSAGNSAEVNENHRSEENCFQVMLTKSEKEEPKFVDDNKITWLLDSGCSDHIVNTDKYFSEVKGLDRDINIKVGDGYIIKALAVGTIVVNFKVGNSEIKTVINNCYFAPDMNKNLLSMSKITDNNHKIWAQENYLEIINKQNKVIARAKKKQNLITDTKRNKLEPKSEKGTLIGYCDMGYRILVNNKIVESRHVKFIEQGERYIRITKENESDEKENESSAKENESTLIRNGCDGNESDMYDNSSGEEMDLNNREPENMTEGVTNEVLKRIRKKPVWHDDYVIDAHCSNVVVPNTFSEAVKSNERVYWQKAMENELSSLHKNKTWTLVDISSVPDGNKIIQAKWIFKVKPNNLFKARLVALGYQQPRELEEEVYSPVARMPTLKSLLSVACSKGWHIEQMDVQTAFLNGKINSEVYIYQPEGFEKNENMVCLLNKALYGLRKSPRTWYDCFHEYMVTKKFVCSKYDSCLYIKDVGEKSVYVILYVDDLLLCSPDQAELKCIKEELNKRFEMKDFGKIKNYLGIDIDYDRDKKYMRLSQTKYIECIARTYNVIESKSYRTPLEINLKLEAAETCPVEIPYRNLIGALLYISQGTRPDISYAVNYLSGFQNNYSNTHFKYALRVLKYLYSTKNLMLNFNSLCEVHVDCYVDADWASDIVDRKSRSGIIVRVLGNPVLWISRKQKVVTRSSCHAEYIALAEATDEVLFLIGIAKDLSLNVSEPVEIFEDNSSAKHLANNGNFSKNSKHIDVGYHYVHDYVKKEIIKVSKISSEEQLADILTKALSFVRFEKLRKLLSVY
ncbi:uncharacterized protein [Leptinotarsa decemlineata]|uniref:uncharacterized protein n=1 Tax=Leptinotarsa decemlineata TaxID=7539 RepID=UPI003D30B3CC